MNPVDDILLPLPTEGVEEIEREHPAGLLRYESYPVGTWRTQKGTPAKKSKRRYLLDGDEIDSVSSIVDTLSKDALVRWAEDHGMRGAVQAERMGELDGVPPEEFIDRVHALGLGASAARDEGAARGTAIHTVMEKLARHGEAPNPIDYPPEWRPWMRGAVAAWLELQPDPMTIEQITCNPDLRYAGRPDLVAVCDGQMTLIDWKSGKGRVYDQSHIQTRLYEMALQSEGVEIERIVIVGIDDQGNAHPYECEATEHDALATLSLYRSRKRINAGMAAQRKARKARAAA